MLSSRGAVNKVLKALFQPGGNETLEDVFLSKENTKEKFIKRLKWIRALKAIHDLSIALLLP